tara:strand:+ start:123 stop:512 length:390 start_codon:yes stop_codon:yes gene_type:complete
MERLPKLEYFKMRLEQAKEAGLSNKAEYYVSRIEQLEGTRAPKKAAAKRAAKSVKTPQLAYESFTDDQKASLRARVKAKFDTLDENGKLIEANKFYKACEGKGISMNNAMALLSECGIDSTIVMHAMTF